MARQYFIRFILYGRDPNRRKLGAFQGAYDLKRSLGLFDPNRETLENLLAGFSENLQTPNRLTRTKSKGQFRAKKGLSWFKPGAMEAIRKLREMTKILSRHGYIVEELRTERPGFVTYEDELQVAAEPFAETPT
jgi:hypothetical protein